MKMTEIAPSERPRERLLKEGIRALSNTELLAVLLGSGTKDLSVLSLSSRILSHFGALQNLLEASVQQIMEIPGIGPAKALQLKAAFGLALRYSQKELATYEGEKRILDWIRPDFMGLKEERLMGICLDARKRAFHKEFLSAGILSEVLVHPREVFHFAIRHKAHSLLIAHNHPSGDATPSAPDLSITRQLETCGNLLGIPLHDHLILGSKEAFLLRKKARIVYTPSPCV